VASAGISLAFHLGMLATIPHGQGESGSAQDSISDAITAQLISAPATTTIEPTWAPPERLAPIASQLPRTPKLQPMSKGGAWVPPVFDESMYFRASQLTVRPSAAEHITVQYPKEFARYGSLRTMLAIFINEDGVVARIEVTGQRLPPAFENAALAAFGHARFKPGRIGDQAVKSRMLVEVEFAHEASDEPASPRLVAIPGKR